MLFFLYTFSFSSWLFYNGLLQHTLGYNLRRESMAFLAACFPVDQSGHMELLLKLSTTCYGSYVRLRKAAKASLCHTILVLLAKRRLP